MIFVFHGDNLAASRLAYTEALTKAKSLGNSLQTLDGDKLLAKDLESLLLTANLFSNEAVAIEGLLSRTKSKEKDKCLELLAAYTGPKDILLWEKKEATAASLKPLAKSARILPFKAPTLLFTFLDSLYPGNAPHSLALLTDLKPTLDELFLFTMLVRTVGNLLVAKTAASPKLPPWQLSKLKAQSSHWSERELLNFHSRLLEIDYRIKTGNSKLSYYDHLDILIVDVLG